MAAFTEREITEPVKLCDADGRLNPEARAWSRKPLHICNMSGFFPKKKKWNFWFVLNEDIGFSATIANVDYLGVGALQVIDMHKKVTLSDATVIPQGHGVNMPEKVEEDVFLKQKGTKISFTHTANTVRIQAQCASFQGKKLEADITLDKPPDHETLNVVIPHSDEIFHFTSKQNTLAATGFLKIGDEVHKFEPEKSFGVLDFGRGMWPKTIFWNWGAFNHRQDGDLIGINIGSKWTDGTGFTENGICLNGKLYKVSEDLVFDYDTTNFMRPWSIKAPKTGMMDLTLTPVYDNGAGMNTQSDSKQVAASNHQMLGYYNGTLKAGDRIINVKNAFGWAEQSVGNW